MLTDYSHLEKLNFGTDSGPLLCVKRIDHHKGNGTEQHMSQIHSYGSSLNERYRKKFAGGPW